MNATTNTELAAVQVAPAPAFNTSSAALMMDMNALERMERFANLMATARSTVPQHFQGKPGDCLAVVMQATTWGMNPFAVAQKTHVINGVLGYEAQLVASVINSSSLLADRFNFEWFGPWEKIVGKFKMVESKTKKDDNGNPKKFMMPDWNTNDEQGLGVRVWATIKGETEPRVLELLMTQARTRNSTLWTEDPKQQLAYLAQKRWARLYAPDVILGVYTPDEVHEFSVPVDMGQAEVLDSRPALDSDALIKEGWAKAEKGMAEFGPWFNSMPKSADGKQREILAPHRADMLAKAKQVDDARTVEQPAQKAGNPEAPAVTYEDLKAKIEDAQTLDALMVAADWIGEIADPAQREDLTKRYQELAAKFGG
jgi:RecT family